MGDNAKYSSSLDSSHAIVTVEVPELDVEQESNLVLDVFSRECTFTAAPYHVRIPLDAAVQPGKAFPEKIDYVKNTVTFRISLEPSLNKNDVSSNTFRYGFCQFYSGPLVLETSNELKILTNPELHSFPDRMKMMLETEVRDFQSEFFGIDYIQFQIDMLGLVLDSPPPSPKLSEDQCYRIKVIVEEKHRQENLYTTIQEHGAVLLGLIDILLAVCYDRVTNANELNEANSHTNIQRISGTLSHFVEFSCIASVLRSFYRRSCTYPFYRNKNISLACVERLLNGTESFDRREWIKHELMYAYDTFKSTDCVVMNHYFLKDYIRYNELAMCEERLTEYLKEMKKVLPEVHEETLGFGEEKTVQKLLKDIMALDESDSTDSDDSDTEQEASESCDSDSESLSSDTAKNPNENVLEKLMNLKLSG